MIYQHSARSDQPNPQWQVIDFVLPFEDLEAFCPDTNLIARFPSQDLFRSSLLPLRQNGSRISVAPPDVLQMESLDELASVTGVTRSCLMIWLFRPVIRFTKRSAVVSAIIPGTADASRSSNCCR